MASITAVLQTTALWSGFTGAPGYSHFYWGPGGGTITEAADTATAAMRVFFEAIKGFIPSAATIAVQQEVPVFDSLSGHLEDVANSTITPVATLCTGAGAYTAPAGGSVLWTTGVIRGTRRLRGRTYIVPCAIGAFDSVGTLSSGFQTALQNAANTVRATSSIPMVVWGRPSDKLGDGVISPITGAQVRDKISVLTSRRD